MGAKATFDPVTRIITITKAPVLDNGEWVIDFDIKTDLYSDGKEDWVASEQLRKLLFPVRSVGGDPLVGGKSLGSTFFLDPSWKIRPYEADHVFRVNGNFYSEDGTSPYTTTIGAYNIQVIQSVSSLVDSTVQQLAEIEYGTFQNAVTVDVTSTITGTSYPAGNTEYPVNNVQDAVAIANERGFNQLKIIGGITLGAGDDVSGFIITGQNPVLSQITISTDAQTSECEFREAFVQGVLDGGSIIRTCAVGSISYVNGYIYNCLLNEETITLGGNAEAFIMDCKSGVAGLSTPIIDMGGSGCSLVLSGYSGGITLTNHTGNDPVSMNLDSGKVVLDSTLTDGLYVLRGVGTLIDNSTGTAVVDSNGLVSNESAACAVWETPVSTHNSVDGSFGKLFEAMSGVVDELLKYQGNKMLIDPLQFTMTVYDDDGTTPIKVFDLKDENGVSSITSILQRLPR